MCSTKVLRHDGSMSEVVIRFATADDVERIEQMRLQHAYPGDIALMGSVERAHRYASGRVKLDGIPNPSKVTVVADVADRVEGALQYTFGDDPDPATLAHVRLLISLLGPVGLIRGIPVLRARRRVKIPVPTEAFRIFNLQVDTSRHGQGIATQLLGWADDEARHLGARRMALLADSASPVVRLYERNGYRITKTATDARYERYANDPGRVLMEKNLV